MLGGVQVDLVAPGVNVLSTAPAGSLKFPAPHSECVLKVGNTTIYCVGMISSIASSEVFFRIK